MSFQYTVNDIKSTISKLDPNKAHGYDMISIHMIKLYGDLINKTLEMIFKSCLNQEVFPAEWKKANAVPVYKKGDHQCVKKYRPVSLLLMFSKIFEKLIYNTMFKHFLDNNFLSCNQSGFKPGNSRVIAITHNILKCFDDRLEVRGVFLGISKAFDKAWHEGSIWKLLRDGICGNLLQLSISYLDNRKQRVLLNRQCSS